MYLLTDETNKKLLFGSIAELLKYVESHNLIKFQVEFVPLFQWAPPAQAKQDSEVRPFEKLVPLSRGLGKDPEIKL